jgi:CubicO group peptidase (beta-lactamase class C family)
MSWLASLRHCLCAFIALAAAGPLAAAPATPDPAALERRIDDYLAPLTRTNNFAGVVLIARGDEILLQKGYGLASVEHAVPHGPSTVFHIASVSKPFTAAAIMRLVERGAIDLHAPLSRMLPGYPNGERLTVHHLLSHTSGIPNINGFPEYDEIQYRPHSTAELVAWFRDRPLGFAPGARHEYSNSNYNLLAHIVERVSGLSYGDFLRREILDPLRLAGTGHPAGAAQIVPRLADGYAPAGATRLERARYIDWSVKTGNGSLYATAADIHAFFRAVHGGRVLNPASLAATFTPHTPNVGYGWFVTQANGRALHHINGRSPGWAAQADYYVEEGVTVIVLSNIYAGVTTPIARAVGAMLFGLPHEPLPGLAAEPPSAAAAAPLLGSYRFGADYYVPNQVLTVSRDADGHLIASPDAGSPTGLVPIGPNRFLMRAFWMELEFVPGADGRITHIEVEDFRAGRVGPSAAPAPPARR